MMLFESNRTFRIWDYNVSHKQVLLRSPSSSDDPKNIDIVIWDVEYLNLVTSLKGLRIFLPSTEDVGRAKEATGIAYDPSRVYSFESLDRRFLVVGAGFRVLENELDLFDSSLEYFDGTDAGSERDLGLILAHS